ncbi:MAG TPA: hypothetical protein VIY48_20570 [Candidatus Paceibacterota bacterium]
MIRLRFVSHPGIFNWACQIAQYGYWATHVEAITPTGSLLGAMGDGVKDRPRDYDANAFKREMILEIKSTQEQEEIFYAFIESQIGKPYDTWAILAYFYPSRDWQSFDAWYCSELLGTAFAECGILPKEMAVKFSRVTIRDLLLLISMRTWAE